MNAAPHAARTVADLAALRAMFPAAADPFADDAAALAAGTFALMMRDLRSAAAAKGAAVASPVRWARALDWSDESGFVCETESAARYIVRWYERFLGSKGGYVFALTGATGLEGARWIAVVSICRIGHLGNTPPLSPAPRS